MDYSIIVYNLLFWGGCAALWYACHWFNRAANTMDDALKAWKTVLVEQEFVDEQMIFIREIKQEINHLIISFNARNNEGVIFHQLKLNQLMAQANAIQLKEPKNERH